MKRQVLGLILGVAVLGAGYAQAGVIIDNFDTPLGRPLNKIELSGPSMTDMASDMGAGIFGDMTRTTKFETLVGTGAGDNARVFIKGSKLILGNDPGAQSKVTLTYHSTLGVDLNGASNEKPWLIFHATVLDQELIVDVTLSDGTNTATNEYRKEPIPDPDAGSAVCFPGMASACPQIVGPIFDIDPHTPKAEGNYYHLLDLFKSPGTDPVTGMAFGGENPLLNLDSIKDITISLTAPGDSQDLALTCISTGAAPSGATVPNLAPHGKTFSDGDNLESTQCNFSGVPEPSSVILLGTGFLSMALVGMRARFLRRRQQA